MVHLNYQENNMITEADIMNYLRSKFQGVSFGDAGIKRRFDNYVQFSFANSLLDYIQPYLNKEQMILDIGSGFGSFVYLLRKNGYKAFGIEISDFLVQFSRQRFQKDFDVSNMAPAEVYINDSALKLPFSNCSFDIVTIWNVLEHVSDYKTVIGEAVRVLKPNGKLFLMNVNYASCFIEPHYRVFWLPYLPKCIAKIYLQLLGRNSNYMETGIFYINNISVMNKLLAAGMHISNSKLQKLSEETPIIISKQKKFLWKIITFMRIKYLIKIILVLGLFNPFCSYINIIATKK